MKNRMAAIMIALKKSGRYLRNSQLVEFGSEQANRLATAAERSAQNLRPAGRFLRRVIAPRKTDRTIKRAMRRTYNRGMNRIGDVEVGGSHKQIISRVERVLDETAAKIKGLGDYGRKLKKTRRVAGGLVGLGAASVVGAKVGVQRYRNRKQS